MAPSVQSGLAVDQVCWYAERERRPPISRCPLTCNGDPSFAERQADGVQRFYCEAHAHWRGTQVGQIHLRALVDGEAV